MTNLGFVYDTSFQDVKGFKATGSVLALSDVRSTFSDLLTKGNVRITSLLTLPVALNPKGMSGSVRCQM